MRTISSGRRTFLLRQKGTQITKRRVPIRVMKATLTFPRPSLVMMMAVVKKRS
jgi:hypothetical protein